MKHRAGAASDKDSVYVAAISKQAGVKDAKGGSKNRSVEARPIFTFKQRQARCKEIEGCKKKTEVGSAEKTATRIMNARKVKRKTMAKTKIK